MDFWKLSKVRRAVLASILSLLLALSGVSPQALAEAMNELSAMEPTVTDVTSEPQSNETSVQVGDAADPANPVGKGTEQTESAAAPTPEHWTIVLEANGGVLAEGVDACVTSIESLEDADPVRLPTAFERETYEFAGWSTVTDPAAWQRAREEALAADPNAPEPKDKPLFVPAEASLYNLSYAYVTLEDGTVRQVSDVTATQGSDEEGREVQTCDLRGRIRDGKLTLYAQWKKAEDNKQKSSEDVAQDDGEQKSEKGDDVAQNDGGPKSGGNEVASGTTNDAGQTPNAVEAGKDTEDKTNDVTAPSTENSMNTPDATNAVGAAPQKTTDDEDTDNIDSNAELPKNAEPVADGPTGTAALLADPNIVLDSGAGDSKATALLDAAQRNMQAQELLTQTLAPTQPQGANIAFGMVPLSLTTQSDTDYPLHQPTSFTHPVELDRCEIRDYSIVWVTQDGNPDAQLNLAPSTDAPLNMQGAIQLNLSGENNYAAGTVQLKIPAQAIKKREGEFIGSMTIGVPEEPDTSQSFAYRLVNEGGKDYYVLTNTRTLAPGFTNYIQFTIRDITPHMVQSGAVSPSLQASMTLTSPRGNNTTVYTGMLTASVTTSEEVTHAYKNGGRVMETADVPSDLLGNLPAGANADDYVIVRWNSYANVDGNQSFDFDFTDNLGSITSGSDTLNTAGSLVLGTTEGGGTQNSDGTYIKRVLDDNYLKAGEARYENVWTAYPKRIFDDYNTNTGRQNNFTINNDVEWKLMPVDLYNPNDPTTYSTKTATAHIGYHVPVPVDFSAKPGVYDLTKDTLEPYRYPTSSNVALNTLRKGEDVAIGYTVEGFGETMTYTAETPMDQAALDELAGRISTSQITPNDVFHKRYVTMELADDAVYLNGNYATELNSTDYYVSRVQLKAPTTYTYMHREGDETKEWIYSRDGTQLIPSFSLWGLSEARGGIANDWIELVKVSYDAGGNRTVEVTPAGSGLGVQPDGLNVTLPPDAAITRTKMTAATNWDGLRLAYDVYLSLKAHSTTVSGVVTNLFNETETPSTTLRNDSTLMVYRGNYAAESGSQNAPAINPTKAKLTPGEAQNAIAIKTSADPTDANARTLQMDETRYGQHMYHDASLAYLRGAVPRIGVTSSKSMEFNKDKDLNAPQMRATLHYTAKVHEQSNILTQAEYDAYVREGAIVPETSGTWYDLLPAGVTPDLSTIRLRDKDAVVDSYTIENFENSGRTMLVVKAELTPQLSYNDKVGEAVLNEGYWSQGIYDEPQISFDAVYNYADYAATVETADHQMADQLINVIAFESGNQELGNQEGLIGEPDDATIKLQNQYKNEQTSAAVHGVEDLMSDLHGQKTSQQTLSSKRNTFVYARDESSIVVDRSGEGEIMKHVASDAEGVYRTGLGTVAAGQQGQLVNVYENHGYTYRLSVAKDEKMQGIILYDALERYEFKTSGDDPSQDYAIDSNVDDHRWRGTLASVDVSQLESKGVSPVVYYSTTITGFEVTTTNTQNNLLFDPTTGNLNPAWIKASDYTANPDNKLANVTAIAIDARHRADGTDFKLDKDDKLMAYVHMVAPIDSTDSTSRGYNLFDWGGTGTKDNTDNNKHAFNGVYVYSSLVNEQGGVAHPQLYHPGYTKVGILPYALTVNKVWDDHDNNDGKRPTSVTVQLLADGKQAKTVAGDPIEGQVLSDDNNWKHTYEHIPYVDADNHPIHYSLTETPITEEQEGQTVKLYTPSVLRTDETHLQLTNKRTPETVNVSGTKTWEDNGDAAGKRPSTITVRLLADGEEKARQTVAVATDGTWSYEFADMPAYKDGKKITYRVVEDRVPFYAPSYAESELGSGSQVVDGVVQGSADITNTYSTTGLLAVQKSVTGAKSDAAKNAQFTFKVELFAEQTKEEVDAGADKVPLSDIYSYYVEDVATGQKVAGTGYIDSTGEHKGGTVGTGGTVELGAGQRAVIVGIPAQSTYRVTEEAKSGFRQTSSANTEGVVYASLTSTDAATASFENAYKTSGSFQLKATKALTGQKLGLYAFRFQAYQVFNEGATGDTDQSKNEYEQVVRSASNIAGGDVNDQGVSTGEVTFGRINVSDEDLGPDGTLTLLYRIREVNAGRAGYTYDGRVRQIRVILTDNGEGSIDVTQTPEPVTAGNSIIRNESGDNVTYETVERSASSASNTFENSYNASGSFELTAWKRLKGGVLEAGKFTFRLKALTDGAPMATIKDDVTGALSYDNAIYDATTRSMTAANDDSGVVSFPIIHLTGVHGGKSYIYKVSEDAGDVAGVNYDTETSYYYRVDVVDDGAGVLTATTTVVKPKDSNSITGNPDDYVSSDVQPIITNTLQPGNLAITKSLAQGSAYHDEKFEFKVVLTGDEITDQSSFAYKVGNGDPVTDSNAVATNGSYTMTVRLAKDETATIANIPAGITYQVLENTLAGWTLQDQSGTAGTIAPGNAQTAAFTNNYEPSTAKAQLYATKTLDGVAAANEAFTFVLTGLDGAPMSNDATGNTLEVRNGAGGLVSFPQLTFNEAGTYNYRITEKKDTTPAGAKITYDEAEWTATVTVVNNGTVDAPVFAASVSYSNGVDAASTTPPAFANTTNPGELTVQKVTMPEKYNSSGKDFNFTVQLQNNNQPVNNVQYYITDAQGNAVGTQSLTSQSEGGHNLLTDALNALGSLFTPRKAYAAVTASGTFGENGSCTWEWDKDTKTVTVRATNEGTVGVWEDAQFNMTTYSVPWAIYDEQVGATYEEQMEHFVVATDSDGNGTVSVRGASNLSEMFRGLTNLESVDLSGFDMSGYGSADQLYFAYVFAGCTGLTSLTLPEFGENGISINHLCDGCEKLETVSIPKIRLQTGSYEGTRDFYAFRGCKNLQEIDLSGIEITSNGALLDNMFWGCTSLKDVTLGISGAEYITSMDSMFRGCTSLVNVDFSTLKSSSSEWKLKSMNYMFVPYTDLNYGGESSSLKYVNFAGLNTSNCTKMEYMFAGCNALISLNLSEFNTENVASYNGMFRYCKNLESLDLSGFTTKSGSTASSFFVGVMLVDDIYPGGQNLQKIVFGDGWTMGYDNTRLPDAQWVKVEDVAAGIQKILSSSELMSRSNSDYNTSHNNDYKGTWVRAVDATKNYVVAFNPVGGYYAENGTGSPEALPGSVTAEIGDSVTLPRPKWNDNSKRFVAWRTGYNKETKQYSGSAFEGGSDVNYQELDPDNSKGGYITLFAEWADNTTVTGTIKVYQQNSTCDGYNLVSTSSTNEAFANTGVVDVPATPDGFAYNPEKFAYTGTGEVTHDAEYTKYTVTPTNGAEISFYYDRQTYTVKFDKNADDATGTMIDLSMVGGLARKLPANGFTRTGYSFLGWNTKDDGTGTSYADQAQVKNLAASGEVTLYAQWIPTPSGQPSSTGTYTFTLKAGQTVHFANVPAGTTYSVVETDLPNGWTQTQTESSNTSGTIESNATKAVSVTNTYNATGAVSLQAQKTMTTGALAEGQFSFQLLNADHEVLQTKTNLAPADGTATAQVFFDQIEYELSNLRKEDGTYADREYTYYIREVVPEENDRQPGVTYDNGGDREVKVIVHDTGTGTLAVTPNNLQTTGVGSSTVTTSTTVFTNDYKPGSLEVSKTTIGTNGASANAKFSFEVTLKDAQGKPVNKSYNLVRIAADGTKTTEDNGANFDENGVKIIENIGADEAFRIEGIAADTTYEVTEVNVPGGFTQTEAAGAKDTITAGAKSQASFTNTYEAAGSVTLAAKKTLAGGNLSDYTFTFQLYDETNKLLQTKTSDAAGNVAFDELGFSAADAGTQAAPKKYAYKIAEVNDAQDNVVYDAHSGWLDVNVWDNGQGSITAQAVYDHRGGTSSTTPETFANKLLHPVELPATGGSGLAIPVAVVVIAATAEATRRMRRRK